MDTVIEDIVDRSGSNPPNPLAVVAYGTRNPAWVLPRHRLGHVIDFVAGFLRA